MRALPTIAVVFVSNARGNPSRVVEQARGLLHGLANVESVGVDSSPSLPIAIRTLIAEKREIRPSGVLLLDPAGFEVLPPGSTMVLRTTKSAVRYRASQDFTGHCFSMSADENGQHTHENVRTGVMEMVKIVSEVAAPGVPFPILARLLIWRGLAGSGREMAIAEITEEFVVRPLIHALSLGREEDVLQVSRTAAPVGPGGASPYEGLVTRSKGLTTWTLVHSNAEAAAKWLANSGRVEVVRGARRWDQAGRNSARPTTIYETTSRTVLRRGTPAAAPDRLGDYFGEGDDTGKWPEVDRPIAERAMAAVDAKAATSNSVAGPAAGRDGSRAGPAEEVTIPA